MNITRKDFLKLGLMGRAGLALPIGTWQTARSRISGADFFTRRHAGLWTHCEGGW